MSIISLSDSTKAKMELLSLIHHAISSVIHWDGHVPWYVIYDEIFSKEVSQRIHALLHELHIHFDYCDPDTTYEEDVRAYVDALARLAEDMLK